MFSEDPFKNGSLYIGKKSAEKRKKRYREERSGKAKKKCMKDLMYYMCTWTRTKRWGTLFTFYILKVNTWKAQIQPINKLMHSIKHNSAIIYILNSKSNRKH